MLVSATVPEHSNNGRIGALLTGSVARFDARRGYGFLVPDDGGEDVFVHQNNINMEGFRYLNPGERVRFDVEEGARGRKAVAVELLEERVERRRDDNRRNNTNGNGNGGRRQERRPRSDDRYVASGGDDDGRLAQAVDKLRRKQERLVNILVEKDVLAPGEIDQLPGLEEIQATTGLDADLIDDDDDSED